MCTEMRRNVNDVKVNNAMRGLLFFIRLIGLLLHVLLLHAAVRILTF